MDRVYVSIGSNVDRDINIRGAIAELHSQFSPLILSATYESVPVGFEGDNFYNLVVGFDTNLSLENLITSFHNIEKNHGRHRNQERFGPRTLDLDLIVYGSAILDRGKLHLPRKEITEYAFVLKPLTDIAGDQLHPELGISYQLLWKNFDGDKTSVWPVDFDPLAN